MNNGTALFEFPAKCRISTTNGTGSNTIVNVINTITGGGFREPMESLPARPSGFSYFGNIGPTWDVALTGD